MSNDMQSDAEVLSHAMRMSGQNDHYFAKMFGVNQSTVSRLRAKKIHKVQKYIDKLISSVDFRSEAVNQIDVAASALAATAKVDPELAELLHALIKFVHKSMH
jgi:predicted XRE-type DNA-binding protein